MANYSDAKGLFKALYTNAVDDDQRRRFRLALRKYADLIMDIDTLSLNTAEATIDEIVLAGDLTQDDHDFIMVYIDIMKI